MDNNLFFELAATFLYKNNNLKQEKLQIKCSQYQ
jgi:hypothetical protein